jgi:hypothetical protein
MANGEVRITAKAFSALIQEEPLDWEPPMRELMQRPEAADFVWRRLQYVFRLRDPRTFPKLDIDGSRVNGRSSRTLLSTLGTSRRRAY